MTFGSQGLDAAGTVVCRGVHERTDRRRFPLEKLDTVRRGAVTRSGCETLSSSQRS